MWSMENDGKAVRTEQIVTRKEPQSGNKAYDMAIYEKMYYTDYDNRLDELMS